MEKLHENGRNVCKEKPECDRDDLCDVEQARNNFARALLSLDSPERDELFIYMVGKGYINACDRKKARSKNATSAQ